MGLRIGLPNLITASRVVLAPLVFFLILRDDARAFGAGAAIFLVCGILDKVDGWLARRLDQVSTFGIIWDPLADKIVILGAMLAAAAKGLMPLPFVYLCIARDLLVSGFRAASNLPPKALAADRWGKWKTRLQFAFVMTALLQRFLPAGTEIWYWRFYWTLLVGTAFATVASGWRYARKYRAS